MIFGENPRNRDRDREAMIYEQLERRGIRAPRVLDALRRIPRDLFVPADARDRAYADSALAIECGQTISQPYMVARMTELLALEPAHRVLEIGTGSGYQTAVLACLCAHVYTVEWYAKLMSAAAERLAGLKLANVTYRCGDGSLGWPEHGPYDAIIVTAGAPDVPPALVEQLGVGGRLVAPVGGAAEQTLVRLRRNDTGIERESLLSCRFVKLVGEQGWRE